jgi:hypothetical protein
MKRYLFHVASGRRMYMDENGRDFSDLKDAKAYAATIAAELARDGGYVGGSVVSSMKAVKNWTACR